MALTCWTEISLSLGSQGLHFRPLKDEEKKSTKQCETMIRKEGTIMLRTQIVYLDFHSLKEQRLTHLPWFNICASHTVQLVCRPPPRPPPPKIYCITFVFNFSWVIQSVQEKLKTIREQNFGSKIVGNVQIASRFFFSSFNNYLVFAGVCLTRPCDWLKNIAPLSQPIRFDQLRSGYMHFPAPSRLLRKLTSKPDWLICNIVCERYVWREWFPSVLGFRR